MKYWVRGEERERLWDWQGCEYLKRNRSLIFVFFWGCEIIGHFNLSSNRTWCVLSLLVFILVFLKILPLLNCDFNGVCVCECLFVWSCVSLYDVCLRLSFCIQFKILTDIFKFHVLHFCLLIKFLLFHFHSGGIYNLTLICDRGSKRKSIFTQIVTILWPNSTRRVYVFMDF